MNSAWKLSPSMPAKQTGMTLIELLVAAVVSVIAVSAMVILMGNTLGTGTMTIEQVRLTQEMRTGMQIVSRELRRANYHADFLQCYGNVGCRTAINDLDGNGDPITVDISGHVTEINITDGGTSDCIWFWYDRPQACNQASCTQTEIAALQTSVTGEYVAAFRRDTNTDGVGSLQMTTTTTTAPNCNLDTGWVDITDPNLVDITGFNVSDALSVCEDLGTSGNSQTVERIAITLTAEPVCDPSLPGFMGDCSMAERTVTEFIKVRNNFTSAGVACP